MNRQNVAARRIFFFSFIMRTAYWRNESSCVSRRCAANRKKSAKIKFGNCKVGPHCLLAQRRYSTHYPPLILQQISASLYGDHGDEQSAAYCLFVRKLLIDLALLGRKRKHIKLKTTAKLKGKKSRSPWSETYSYQVSIATFPTPCTSFSLPTLLNKNDRYEYLPSDI